jgi:uncharacterized protein (TIGR00255 family)
MNEQKKSAVRSMTGYGRGEASGTGRTWVAEMRTVNHRFLDCRILLPKAYSGLEERVRKLIGRSQERGRVEMTLQQQGTDSTPQMLNLNIELAEQYHRCLQQVNEELGLGYHITLGDMLNLREIITVQDKAPDLEAEWTVIRFAVQHALDDCRRMREQEGHNLQQELSSRLFGFQKLVTEVKEAVPEIIAARQQELHSRFERFLNGVTVDPIRLAQEAAILADKADVTEELVRLESHIRQFSVFLESGEPVGRRLDFLLQEFLREVNTLGSKINNASIAHLTVEMKNEVEKLKEQVQNLE